MISLLLSHLVVLPLLQQFVLKNPTLLYLSLPNRFLLLLCPLSKSYVESELAFQLLTVTSSSTSTPTTTTTKNIWRSSPTTHKWLLLQSPPTPSKVHRFSLVPKLQTDLYLSSGVGVSIPNGTKMKRIKKGSSEVLTLEGCLQILKSLLPL